MTIKKYIYMFIAILSALTFSNCQPEEFPEGNGLANENIDASFTVIPVDGSPNRFRMEATGGSEVWHNKWELGDGNPAFRGEAVEEIFYPDAGTYTITHTAYGQGGASNTAIYELVVATSDPVAGNLARGGKFATSSDHDEWTILNISPSGTSWTFSEGSATVSGGGWNQQGIYQAIEVEANKEYAIDMRIFGQGSIETWFEVYASPTPPVQGSDYSADGRRMGLSTWDGCATSPYDGKLSMVGCVGSGNVVSFPESGTIYLLIKCGGNNIGTGGISITNVEFRGVPQN